MEYGKDSGGSRILSEGMHDCTLYCAEDAGVNILDVHVQDVHLFRQNADKASTQHFTRSHMKDPGALSFALMANMFQ